MTDASHQEAIEQWKRYASGVQRGTVPDCGSPLVPDLFTKLHLAGAEDDLADLVVQLTGLIDTLGGPYEFLRLVRGAADELGPASAELVIGRIHAIDKIRQANAAALS